MKCYATLRLHHEIDRIFSNAKEKIATGFFELFFFLCVIDDFEAEFNYRANIEQRDGKAYMIASDIFVTNVDFQDFKIEFVYDYVPVIIASMIDKGFISNWKMVKSLMDPTIERYAADLIKSLVVPILEGVPLQDIINMESPTGEHC